MEEFLKGRGDSIGKGDAVSLDTFFSWGVANVLTLNSVLVIVFLFPLNVGVSPCFHCIVLVMFTVCVLPVSIIQLLVLVTGYILPVCRVDERVHTYSLTYGQSVVIHFYMMGLGASFTMREVASIASNSANCHYGIYQDTFST